MSIINIAKKQPYHSQIALRRTSESSQPHNTWTSTRYTRVQDRRPQLPPSFSKKSSYFSAGGQQNDSQFCFLPSFFYFFPFFSFSQCHQGWGSDYFKAQWSNVFHLRFERPEDKELRLLAGGRWSPHVNPSCRRVYEIRHESARGQSLSCSCCGCQGPLHRQKNPTRLRVQVPLSAKWRTGNRSRRNKRSTLRCCLTKRFGTKGRKGWMLLNGRGEQQCTSMAVRGAVRGRGWAGREAGSAALVCVPLARPFAAETTGGN